jgi:hypothetical protein
VSVSFSRTGLNADGTRLYVGDQAGGNSANWAPVVKVRIIDVSKSPPMIFGEVDGPGPSVDWSRSGFGREYVLHSNEAGSAGVPGQAAGGDTCKRYPRPFSLGGGFEAFLSDVTRADQARNVSMLRLAINDPSGKPQGTIRGSAITLSTTRTTRSLRRYRSEPPGSESSTSANRLFRARWRTSITAH